jgi:hypothetical protein
LEPAKLLQLFMNRFFMLLGLLLIPVLSQARIGEAKAEFEARYNKPVTLETAIAKLSQNPSSDLAPAQLEKTRRLCGDIHMYEDGAGSYVAAWYKLGKVVGEFHRTTGDEDVVKVLEATLGTSDLDEYASENLVIQMLKAFALKGTMSVQSYITKDQKFIVYAVPTQGVLIGTKIFITEFEARLAAMLAENLATSSPAQGNVSPEPATTPQMPSQYFNDYAGVIAPRSVANFNDLLTQFERETSNQIIVVIYPKLSPDTTVEQFAEKAFRAWKPGQAGRNNGVLVLIFVDDRKVRIQTGLGLEKALPDKVCGEIIATDIVPNFRKGDYNGGIEAALNSIMNATRDTYKGDGKTIAEKHLERLQHPSLGTPQP